jgi:hypothetical protein
MMIDLSIGIALTTSFGDRPPFARFLAGGLSGPGGRPGGWRSHIGHDFASNTSEKNNCAGLRSVPRWPRAGFPQFESDQLAHGVVSRWIDRGADRRPSPPRSQNQLYRKRLAQA